MATLTLRLLKHSSLLSTTHSCLHYDAGSGGDLLGLNGDLFCQLSCGRNDNGPDVVGPALLVATDLLAKLGIVGDDSLDDGNEETEGFTRAGLGLCDTAEVSCNPGARLGLCLHIRAVQSLVDGPGLHIGHGGEPHLPRDGVDEVWVHQTTFRQFIELCDGALLFRLCLLSGNLLPLGAVVEARSGGIHDAGGRYPEGASCSERGYAKSTGRYGCRRDTARECRGTCS